MNWYFYDTTYTDIYEMSECYWIDILQVNASLKRPQRVLGHRHRYHDTTTPHLDFRLYPESSV